MTARGKLLLAMMAAIALIAMALLLDEQREFEAAIDNLKAEQIALATAVAADFETRLKRLEAAGAIRPEATQVDLKLPRHTWVVMVMSAGFAASAVLMTSW